MSSEPDRKYPSPLECKWCSIADCDEKIGGEGTKKLEDEGLNVYVPDFF